MKKAAFIIVTLFSLSTLYSQNVGIGTASPAFRLDVQGRMRVKTGTLGNVSTSGGIWFDDFRDGSNQFLLGMRDSIQFGFYSSTLGWDLFYNSKTGNLGLGVLNPTYKLAIDGRAAFWSGNNLIGTLGYATEDFMINARTGSTLNGISPANIIFQYNNIIGGSAGKIGIGTASPDAKLQVEGGSDVNGISGGVLQLGSSAGTNLGLDQNEIQARNNGVPAKLFIQSNGEDLQIGGTNNITINNGYQVYRNRPLSSNADLLPIAYAKVSSSGNALSGTGNLSITKPDQGEYRLFLLGENNMYANSELYTIIVTINGNTIASPKYSAADIRSDNAIYVTIAVPRINYVNKTVGGETLSYLSTNVYADRVDSEFSIIIYKM